MHSRTTALLLALSMAPWLSTTSTAAEITLGAGSRIMIDGDSTLHRFSATSSSVHASLALGDASGDVESLLRSGALESAQITLPVTSLSSGEGGLDKNMWRALKAEQAPTIVFRALTASVAPPTAKDAAFTLKLHGRLSIAGVERETDVEGQAFRTLAGLRVVGSKELVMSDYGVTPPVLFAGMIRVKDRIVVRFDVVVESVTR